MSRHGGWLCAGKYGKGGPWVPLCCAHATRPAGAARGPSGKPWAPGAVAGEGAERQGRAPFRARGGGQSTSLGSKPLSPQLDVGRGAGTWFVPLESMQVHTSPPEYVAALQEERRLVGPNDKAGFQELGNWLFVRTAQSRGRVLGASGVRWARAAWGPHPC